jgi:hypothetical protein
MIRVIVALIFACTVWSANAQSRTDCVYKYWMSSESSHCFLCGEQPPPWGSVTHSAYFKQFYLLCRGCSVPCQVRTSGTGECQAKNSDGEHLGDALLFGISPSQKLATAIEDLKLAAPEIALFLAGQQVFEGGAPQVDQRFHRAALARMPTPGMITAMQANPSDMQLSDVERMSFAPPVGKAYVIESLATPLVGDLIEMTIRSLVVEAATGKEERTLNAYSFVLREERQQTVPLHQYSEVRAKLLSLVKFSKL